MENKMDQIPDDMSIHEAGEFWDSHSVADIHSKLVQFEYHSGEHRAYVAVASDLLWELENKAKMSGMSVETLVNRWIQEKLAG